MSPRSRRDRKTRTSRNRWSGRPPGPCSGISRRPWADTPVTTTSARQTTRCPTRTSRWVAPGEAGEPGAVQAAGEELVHALVDARRGSARPSSARYPIRCPGPAPGRPPCGWRPPRLRAEQITAHRGLVHPPAGVEQGREEGSGPKLGDGELDLAGGGGHRVEALAVAPVGALTGARRGAPRRSRRRPRRRPGPHGPARSRRRKTPVQPGPDRQGLPGSAWTRHTGSWRASWEHLQVNPDPRTGHPTTPAALPGRRTPSTPRAPRESPPH